MTRIPQVQTVDRAWEDYAEASLTHDPAILTDQDLHALRSDYAVTTLVRSYRDDAR